MVKSKLSLQWTCHTRIGTVKSIHLGGGDSFGGIGGAGPSPQIYPPPQMFSQKYTCKIFIKKLIFKNTVYKYICCTAKCSYTVQN